MPFTLNNTPTRWHPMLLVGALAMPGLALAQAAPKPVPKAPVKVETLLKGLDHPWSLAFLPDNQGALITERSGNLRLWQAGKPLSAPVTGVPAVWVQDQAGLWDVRPAPDFAKSRRVYLSFAQKDDKGRPHAELGYGTLSQDGLHLENFKTIFIETPPLDGGINLGGRLIFDPQGNILMSLGDNNQRIAAQQLDSLRGKIIRLTPEGGIPQDNPFVKLPNARPEIWTYGNRNPQALAYNPWSGELWETEHGPRGGDEVNILKAGKNYGWPFATYGINYNGLPIPEAKGSHLDGMEDPLYYWRVSPAVSGMAFYNDSKFPQWKNSLFVGALKETTLIQLKVNDKKVLGEKRMLTDLGQRIREVQVGPDGYVYVLTDEKNGKLFKLSPK
ncbi:PQQ-dependent sugar dehydrogenase [Rouxiella badensis]|jgi:glucose/arabinose dehydrogenase|uniref:Oxidoreductase n=1 Tax=Rouxiella badensis TaxID=1646377 RepID=A0A1X0WI17_9GAMM|nr:PQQ-dependent sugar dehydrogenase [Rouxiella badensis]MCC3703352.1 PQQ-dependent sugar dehydrogenase [Rouxiella badensis]MCC3718291.1 PQQ-dependent sugar dehydrogenase [Rouxiella badensis]MCC3726941.1 PQQ-dependent sugar dehydrogenase [Rouxiella badensis]MCC3731775.1 PQQ-dependent sugar dehydrogenase [Rouxiella badensis]MCC3738710.1 PQQ-dependent sugar dehydrogenase [Rouxiella badensis]